MAAMQYPTLCVPLFPYPYGEQSWQPIAHCGLVIQYQGRDSSVRSAHDATNRCVLITRQSIAVCRFTASNASRDRWRILPQQKKTPAHGARTPCVRWKIGDTVTPATAYQLLLVRGSGFTLFLFLGGRYESRWIGWTRAFLVHSE